ncbi:MAG TPA: hypothetical protein VFU98_01550, partial [Microlunatus sp.]|nr:hypothetical protein [Microlunatus sp.]
MVVVVCLVAVTIAVWPRSADPVYVTDGSHVFTENLRAVENLIHQENQRVVNSGKRYVSIAYAHVMTPGSDDALNEDLVRHEVEGAHLAQLAWNHPLGDPPEVLVRLLLADEGARGDNWSQTAKALTDRIGGTDRLVAVTGLGISVDNTRNLINALSTHKLAIVTATLTGDNMTMAQDGRGPVAGMVRVAPTNSNQAQAAVHFLDRQAATVPDHAVVLLVQDQNRADEYALSLGAAFTKALSAGTTRQHSLVPLPMTFDSSLGNAAMILGSSADRVCTAQADIVYFAGREDELQGFLSGLATRSCAGKRHLTVVSGDAIAHLAGERLWQGGDANMTVTFTTLAHPGMWSEHPEATTKTRAARFDSCGGCYRQVFPGEPPDALDDTGVITGHDAVWTAVKALEYTRNTEPSA